MDPVGADGKPQLGQKKLVKGEKSFFLMPGEKLEKGIQNVFVLGEDEGLILRAIEAFTDPDSVSGNLALCGSTLLSTLAMLVVACLSFNPANNDGL